MPNKKERIKVVDYLYAEMTQNEKEAFDAELNSSPGLKENISNLKNLRKSIHKWKGSEVPSSIVDSFAIYSAARKMGKADRSRLQLSFKAVFAAAIFIVLLAVLNLNVSFSNSGFSIRFGVLSSQTSVVIPEKFSSEMDKNNKELLQIVRGYILERDQRQIDEIIKMIKASEIQTNERRKYELKAIYAELANLKLNTNRYLVNANQAIQGLFQYVYDIDSHTPNTSGNSI
jgi:hypothetical protein